MKNTKKLTILHSNDLHGDFLAEEIDKNLVGGVSMLSGYVEKVRAEKENVIYAVAGDMFRGSLIDSEYKGISTIEIMNLLAPDIVTIGNHELDYGIAHLLFLEKCAKFPIINANVYIKTTNTRLFTPYKIIEMDGMRILFIGIITEEVMAQARREDLIGAFIDTFDAAREVERICNAYRSVDIDFTVLLTHIGFEEDKKLARLLSEESGVDLILGGHSHTMMEQPYVENGIMIAHAGDGTDQIGHLDLVIDMDRNTFDSYEWKLVPIDETHCPRNLKLEELIENYKRATDAKYVRHVTNFHRQLTHPERNQETELGNLFADIIGRSLGVDIMLLASGSIRKPSLGPIVCYSDLMEIFPFDDGIYLFKVTGKSLKKMLHFMLREEAFAGNTEFYQVSKGLKMIYSRSKRAFEEFSFQDVPVEEERLYTLALQGFHFLNIEDFLGVAMEDIRFHQMPRLISSSSLDILEEALISIAGLDAKVEGRITIVD